MKENDLEDRIKNIEKRILCLENELEDRIKNLEEDMKKLRDFLEKWLKKFYEDWVRLRHNALINTTITMKQINQESQMFYESFLTYKELKERIEKLKKEVPRKLVMCELLLYMCSNGTVDDFQRYINYFKKKVPETKLSRKDEVI